MARRKRQKFASRKKSTIQCDRDDGEPIVIPDAELEAFDAQLKERVERWAEEYAEIVDQLPLELQRTFNLMKELDYTTEASKEDIRTTWRQYCDARDHMAGCASGSTSPTESAEKDEQGIHGRKWLLSSIQAKTSAAISVAEEKLALALSAYDTVDRQIRRLDIDLLKNERSLYAGLRKELEEAAHPTETYSTPMPKDTDRFSSEGQLHTFWSGLIQLDPLTCLAYLKEFMHGGTATSSASDLPKKRSAATQKSASPDPSAQIPKVENIDYDPSEPRYCYCDRVSYGEMVACDNEDCPREWFHYACVGLEHPPKGHWYCQFCAPSNWKGPGTKIPADARYRPSSVKRARVA